jgi:hypothetical protein
MQSALFARNFRAGGAIGFARLVVHGTADDTVVQASAATGNLLGVCVQPGGAASGERADVALSGVVDVEAGAAITRGSLITADAQGRAIVPAPAAGANARTAGVAMAAAVAAGDIIPVLLSQGSIQG